MKKAKIAKVKQKIKKNFAHFLKHLFLTNLLETLNVSKKIAKDFDTDSIKILSAGVEQLTIQLFSPENFVQSFKGFHFSHSLVEIYFYTSSPDWNYSPVGNFQKYNSAMLKLFSTGHYLTWWPIFREILFTRLNDLHYSEWITDFITNTQADCEHYFSQQIQVVKCNTSFQIQKQTIVAEAVSQNIA